MFAIGASGGQLSGAQCPCMPAPEGHPEWVCTLLHVTLHPVACSYTFRDLQQCMDAHGMAF